MNLVTVPQFLTKTIWFLCANNKIRPSVTGGPILNKVFSSALIALLFYIPHLNALTVTGVISYEKTVYSSSGTSTSPSEPLYGAQIKAFSTSGTELSSATTGLGGAYSLDTGAETSYRIVVYAQSSYFAIGSGLSGSTATGVYRFTTDVLTGTAENVNISIANKSGAFNILNQLERGRRWFSNLGHNLTTQTGVLWPSSQGSFFEPSAKIMHILGVGSDIDEFDDDIILHEFGHLAMDYFSLDHSLGGGHNLSAKYDLRLAWSEGAATYISSAIRNNSVNLDFTGGSTPSQVDINSPNSAQTQSSNEIAVANVLWKATQQDGSAQNTISALAQFKNLPSSLANEQISMDTFWDVYTGSSIATAADNRGMAYKADSLPSNSSSSNATEVVSTQTFSSLTFFPSKASDWFKFSGNAGDGLIVTTANTGNGALTFLKLYDESLNLLATNEQASTSVSETTSKLDITINVSGNYFIESGRFTSTTKNVGYDASSGAQANAYSKTVGRYGNYDLNFNITRSSSSSTTASTSTTVSNSTPTSTSTTTALITNNNLAISTSSVTSSGGGGGGGGCLLK